MGAYRVARVIRARPVFVAGRTVENRKDRQYRLTAPN
jgi:hypothetical protein